jgi:hypothetical protein
MRAPWLHARRAGPSTTCCRSWRAWTPRFSLGQLYDGLACLGDEHEKVVEIYNAHVAELFGRDTSSCYFDCTNFYFGIDRKDGFRRKGPSKEHRPEPIVGMGLLLDADCIPIGMSVFPGNESEKPQLRKVISQLRERNAVTGRTVRVADKGLNCADSVADAVLAKDGYIFSKSVKGLPAAERAWALSDEGWADVGDGHGGRAVPDQGGHGRVRLPCHGRGRQEEGGAAPREARGHLQPLARAQAGL